MSPLPARSTDPETSHEAAARLDDLTPLQAVVVETLRELGGRATNEELVEASGVAWRSLTPRVRPLCEMGVVRDSGERREASTGREQVVWELVPRDPQLELI